MKTILVTFGIIGTLLILANTVLANNAKIVFEHTEINNTSDVASQCTAFVVSNHENFLTIENVYSQSFNVKIYDEEGKLVFSINSNKNLEKIDTSPFYNGKYFYFVTNNKGQHMAGHFNLGNAKVLAVF